ncbi:MAG: HEAT repeat domain-containing protein [Paludibacter sp.]
MKVELDLLANRFGELVKKPNKTPAEIQEKEEVRIALEAAYAEDEKPLIDALVEAGLNVTSSWDLVNTKSSYKVAIPILVEHLPKPYHIKNKEGIVRALAVKEAKGVACRAIIDEYHRAPKDDFNYRWTFGNTMAVIITAEYVDDVIAIVQNESNGESRHMFVTALGNTKSPRAKEPLQQLLKDKDKTISKEAHKALKKIK